MKKLLILFVVVMVIFLVPQSVYAKGATLIAVSEYRNGGDMDLLFEQSIRVLSYTEGGKGIVGKVISLLSEDQVHALIDKDIHPQVLESNPDIDRYVLLYNPKANQEQVLKPYGETTKISPYYTLLKIPAGSEFINEGPVSKFFRIPFVERIERPIETTPVVPNLSPTAIPKNTNRNDTIVGLAVIVVIVILLGAGFLIWKKRSSQNQISSN